MHHRATVHHVQPASALVARRIGLRVAGDDGGGARAPRRGRVEEEHVPRVARFKEATAHDGPRNGAGGEPL